MDLTSQLGSGEVGLILLDQIRALDQRRLVKRLGFGSYCFPKTMGRVSRNWLMLLRRRCSIDQPMGF
jgi:mRNA-degrading endonuclease toxin of MazEF toxin-antitoxin module